MKSILSTTVTTLGLLAAVTLSTTPAQAAGDAAAGQEKAAICATCHGADGKTPIDPSYPIIAGQHADYLAVAMKEYKSGERNHAVMSAQAITLSNQDIEDLAAYFADLEGPLGIRK